MNAFPRNRAERLVAAWDANHAAARKREAEAPPAPDAPSDDAAPELGPPSLVDPVLVEALRRLRPEYAPTLIASFLENPRAVSQRAGLDLAEAVNRAGYRLPAHEGAPFTLAPKARTWPAHRGHAAGA